MKDPENYLKVFSKVNANPVGGIKKEQELYGAPHTDIGILIGKKWQLPVEMLNVIMLHHRNTSNVANDKVRGMVAMVKVANVIVSEVSLGSYMTEEARSYQADGAEELMIDAEIVNTIRRALIAFS